MIVYNWGEYLDPEVLDHHVREKRRGSRSSMRNTRPTRSCIPKVQSGAIAYDVVCPSDYMIQRMIENDLLAEIDWDNIPNIKNIGRDLHGAVQGSSTRRTNTPCLTAGERSGSSTTRPWWTSLSIQLVRSVGCESTRTAYPDAGQRARRVRCHAENILATR